ncbi:DUF411 domain-containing protein [Oleiagrimonas sp. C23AA]|jgi:hypothetical protein|uniref:DUF411 domain-containing protein n=1 Tax=Oleiagrimonas sp. C23AA TaxID=2719047 RepID=UPI00142349F7|nr:DUF411 domain-containing protein [Oleiagrimonas sp. C23AA]NII11045.1 DUF411 domain-containing protein [Oleiagrimonas sp. C23AA]
MKRGLFRVITGLVLAALMVPALAMASSAEVFRDPSCGCCGAWIHYLQSNGYTVVTHEDQPMAAVKARLGVPADAASCHTALIGGYVIEGHVPVEDIQRLLTEHPDARGLATPGMPMGSPGMEMGTPVRYEVLLIARDGSTRVFGTHAPQA